MQITKIPLSICSFILVLQALVIPTFADDPWSFVVFPDWHGSETFASLPKDHPWFEGGYERHAQTLKYIKENFKGDLALIPGDTNNGKWHTKAFKKKLGDPSLKTVQQVVRQAGHNCYSTMRQMFAEGGYEKFLVAVGDHELGGNGWTPGSQKNRALKAFRDSFQKELNRDETGSFMYGDNVGNAPSRPLGTIYENTSYAHRHKNALFLVVDVFYNKGEDFMNRKNGLGGEGSITVSVQGDHLDWFENVLSEARKDDSIRHIIVAGHIPISQPIRKMNSSGQFFDNGTDSGFWQAMVKFGVDLYLAGEVHANTASMDGNVVQVVSRGNQFNNFLSIEITDDALDVKSFNEKGPLPRNNNNYSLQGGVKISKSSPSKSFESFGALELLNPNVALVRYTFEEMVPLESRQVIGMKHDDSRNSLIGKEITIRGVVSHDSIPNKGEFGQLYDAQAENVELVANARHGHRAAKFDASSRVAINAVGPHGASNIISYTLWIKTSQQDLEMTLVHYGKIWGEIKDSASEKDIHTLTLDNGNPVFYTNYDSILTSVDDLALNDNKWHHLAVSMPKKSCLTSEIDIYVDGKKIQMNEPKIDKHIFHMTSGRMSLGGLGYSAAGYDNALPQLRPYVGLMDDFMVFARPLQKSDFLWMLKRNFIKAVGWTCDKTSNIWETFPDEFKICSMRCSNRLWCKGYEWTTSEGQPQCLLFRKQPQKLEKVGNGARCAVLLE